MSAFKNVAAKNVTHRERAQPVERRRLGLLEKHKDYTLRAKDHNKKKAQLAALRRKAEDRNEDEFYFGMMSRKGPSTVVSKGKRWTGTVDGDRGNKVLDLDTVRLLKTQDMGYIRTVRNVALKEVKQLEERIIQMGGSVDASAGAEAMNLDDDGFSGFEDEDMPQKKVKPKKTVFAEGIEERERRIQSESQKQADGDEDDIDGESPESLRAEQRRKLREKLQRRLLNSRKKLKTLSRAEHELGVQRAKMAKTATSGGVTKSGKKIKVQERKR
ncbi:U3 small nucleolar RNA-associated protein 11 [Biscogniauxia marginata]|nr:U3 small nucleolar RNA-associated protein 11 [Biscogniauxia marginata]